MRFKEVDKPCGSNDICICIRCIYNDSCGCNDCETMGIEPITSESQCSGFEKEK